MRWAGLGGDHLLLGNRDLFLCGSGVGLRGDHGSLVRLGSSDRLVVLLLGDHVLRHQRCVPLQVKLRFGVVRFRLRDLGLRLIQQADGPLHLRIRGQHVGVCRRKRAVGLDTRNRHVHPGRLVVGLGCFQIRLVLRHRYFVIVRIDLRDQSTGGDILVLFDGHVDDVPLDACADLDDVAIDLRVVGVFIERRMPVVEQRAHYQYGDDEEENEAASPFLLRILALLLITALLLLLVLGAGPAGFRILFRHGHFPPRNS